MVGHGGGADRCVFCEIAKGNTPAHLVYEDESTAAFLDLYPFTRGHLLVIPKRHAVRLTDLPFDDQVALLKTIGELCRRTERLTPDYNLGLNAGSNAGQVVFHVHFHIIPRYGEGNPYQTSERERLKDEEARELIRALGHP
jgi:histidine triad (HIT) family protein